MPKFIKNYDDNGWISISLIAGILSAYFSFTAWNISILFAVVGFFIGIIYENLIEFLAHGWLQHGKYKSLVFFQWRHERHHIDPETHHALQPISITILFIVILFLPFSLTGYWISNGLMYGVFGGFLLNHVWLNVLHYDLHASKKILPQFLFDLQYFNTIKTTHYNHHLGEYVGRDAYSITFPILDNVYYFVKIDVLADLLFEKFDLVYSRFFTKPLFYKRIPKTHRSC